MAMAPWIATFQGLVIALSVLACNFVGEGLPDGLDSRLRHGAQRMTNLRGSGYIASFRNWSRVAMVSSSASALSASIMLTTTCLNTPSSSRRYWR